MKYLIATGLAAIAALCTVTAVAQETEDNGTGTGTDAAQHSEMYLEEIRAACEAEATGLPDPQDYIEECIKNMQQGFGGGQD